MNKTKIILIVLTILILSALTLGLTTNKGFILMARLFSTESTVKRYSVPEKTNWLPQGPRNAGDTTTQENFARLLHTGTHGSDEVSLAIAPAFEFDWIAEENFFLAEGPVFDGKGNIYFCPIFPPEDIILMSLEPNKGARRWVLPGFGPGCGTPLIFEDPITKKDIIYVATYDRAVALNTDGTILWDVPTGLPAIPLNEGLSEQHSFGVNYHRQLDALVAVMGDGSLYVLDRATGKQLLDEPYVLPGDKLPVNNFNLPKPIFDKADKDIAHMYNKERIGHEQSPTAMVLHSAAGELQKVTNFFSVDQNNGRLWIAATLMDEDDGIKDGWSDWGGLYGVDLIKQDGKVKAVIANVFKVKGGTSSTPALSADGQRIYIGDAFDSIYAVDAKTAKEIWRLNVGAKINGSLVVSADNGEVYANIREQIVKVIDRGDHGEKIWTTKLDMFDTGLLQTNFKALGAELGANGMTFSGAAGITVGKMKFPLKLGVGLIDRETGEVKYFAGGGEDSVSSMVTGPDGGIYVGNSPLRRAFGRAILGQDKSPNKLKAGVTKFKVIRHDLLIRDALWAAATRADNTANYILSHPKSVKQDMVQIGVLLNQALTNIPLAVNEGSMTQADSLKIHEIVSRFHSDITIDKTTLLWLSGELKEAVSIVENAS